MTSVTIQRKGKTWWAQSFDSFFKQITTMAQLETSSYSSASQCLAQAENDYVKIEHSKDRGRYFIAKTDVPAGTVVLKVV